MMMGNESAYTLAPVEQPFINKVIDAVA